MKKRDASCPLCGARFSPEALLDACDELVSAELGVLAGRCPHCQGELEVRPQAERLQVGYTVGRNAGGFVTALALPCPGLRIERPHDGGLLLRVGERRWHFAG